jgi:hypothetical protein
MPQKVNPQQGITDQARIYRKDSGTDITSKLGKMTSLSWNINENSEREADVNSGASYRANTDTLVTVDGSVTFRVSAFDIWRLMGDYNESSGTWTVTLTDALPLHRIEAQVQETSDERVLEIYAVKFGRGEINVDKDGFMTATFDYQAVLDDQGNPLYHFHDNETISDPGVEGYSKRGFDTEFTIEGTAVGSGQSFTFIYNRDLDADKGIEPNDGRQRRAPTQLIEQLKDFQVNGDVDITDFQVFKETLDDDTFPLTSQDRRTEKEVGLGLAQSTSGETKWSGAKLNPLTGELANDANKRQVSVEGTATGATITGSTS